MTSERAVRRDLRRLKVHLGGRLHAFTADVSPSGFCAELMQVFLPGSLVHGTIEVGAESYPFRGEVAWARPGNPMASVRSRIGVRFLTVPDELFGERAAGKR
jgi:PilZ domain